MQDTTITCEKQNPEKRRTLRDEFIQWYGSTQAHEDTRTPPPNPHSHPLPLPGKARLGRHALCHILSMSYIQPSPPSHPVPNEMPPIHSYLRCCALPQLTSTSPRAGDRVFLMNTSPSSPPPAPAPRCPGRRRCRCRRRCSCRCCRRR